MTTADQGRPPARRTGATGRAGLWLALAASLAVAACSGSEAALPSGPSASVSPRAVASLADSLAANRSTTARRAFLKRSLVRSGLTPFGDGRLDPQFQTDLGVPVVGGYVPGRHPVGRPELVIVGTRVDGPGVASLLEAVRVLVERSEWVSQPERSVEVAFWPAGDGVRQGVRASLWSRSQIRAVVTVGGAGPAEVDGVPVERLDASLDPLALAQALVDRTTARARYVAPTDSTRAAADSLAGDLTRSNPPR